jgi:hypothetical protein
MAIGTLLGPGIILVVMLLIAWLWDARRLQEVAVTNRRLIHKRHSGSAHVKEINLDKIESVQKSGARIIVAGAGGTKIKMPEFLADETGLRAAILNGAAMPADEHVVTATTPKPPVWKRPIPITLFVVFVVLPLINAVVNGPTRDPDVPRVPQSPSVSVAPISTVQLSREELLSEVRSIEEIDVMGSAKRSVLVRLYQPVDEKVLEIIARSVQGEKPNFERTFIEYLIGDMTYGAGAWATTHFNPNLEVRVLGPSNEELAALANDETEAVVGHWIGQIGAVLTIKEDGGHLYLVQSFENGSEVSDKLRRTETARGIRYDPTEGIGSTGDHYLLRGDGSLEIRDQLGLVHVAPPA